MDFRFSGLSLLRRLGTALGLTMLFAAAAPAVAKETVNVGICVSWPGYSMLKVAQDKGLVSGYDLKFTIFEDPLGGHAALAAGQIDVYGCTADYIPLTVTSGSKVASVAFLNPSYGVDQILLAPGVKPQALKGKKVSAPQAYIGHLLMGLWLESQKVSIKDVKWVNLNADEAVGPMISGDIAAAYMYEPWIGKVTEKMKGASSAVNTADPAMLKTGIFSDVLYMNKDFIAKRRAAALAVLKGRWDGVGYWSKNTAATNKLIADYLKWPLEDVEAVVGTNGKSLKGGIYLYDFDESARLCGALKGEPPFGLANGGVTEVARNINRWWVKLGLMQSEVDVNKGIDCSLMADLVKSGYRQSFAARP